MKLVNLTVISHSCVLPANQRVWARVAALDPLINLRLIAPRRWKSSLHGWLDFEALPELADRAEGVRAHRPGSLHLHTYSDLGPALTAELPDIVFLDEDAHSLVAWQIIGIQAIMSFQTIITLKQNLPRKYPFPFSMIERAMFRSASAAAATSQECLQAARARHYRQPAVVVHYPIDVERFHPGPPCPTHDEKVLRIGYAGRLVAEKGVADLIAAVARLQADHPAELIVAGSGPDHKRLGQMVRELPALEGRVQWAQVPHDQMPEWYRSLDVLVLPSRTTRRWKEQFGRVLAEAMACGVPVVGSDSGFIPELIGETGGGLTYPEGDVPALADALARLAASEPLRRELAAKGRQRTVELYSLDAVAAKLVELVRYVPVP